MCEATQRADSSAKGGTPSPPPRQLADSATDWRTKVDSQQAALN